MSAVHVANESAATVITLDHPATRNSLAVADLERLADAFATAHDSGYVVLRSASPGAFCSGLRLDDAGRADLASGAAARAHAEATAALAACPAPVVAVVDGPAVGLGCELALRSDVRIGTGRALFCVPAGRLGLRYPGDALAALTAAVGATAMSALFVAGLRVPAERALAWGLLHDLVSDDPLTAAHRILAPLDPASTVAAKHAISRRT